MGSARCQKVTGLHLKGEAISGARGENEPLPNLTIESRRILTRQEQPQRAASFPLFRADTRVNPDFGKLARLELPLEVGMDRVWRLFKIAIPEEGKVRWVRHCAQLSPELPAASDFSPLDQSGEPLGSLCRPTTLPERDLAIAPDRQVDLSPIEQEIGQQQVLARVSPCQPEQQLFESLRGGLDQGGLAPGRAPEQVTGGGKEPLLGLGRSPKWDDGSAKISLSEQQVGERPVGLDEGGRPTDRHPKGVHRGFPIPHQLGDRSSEKVSAVVPGSGAHGLLGVGSRLFQPVGSQTRLPQVPLRPQSVQKS